ncbi:MAG: glycine cleavage system protein GcvH [Myxococcales bacterium]|nr:glycine cleavage system protein GcvH [Polyangiaceae bacterium]MDW8247893.1 glycine cleavage system protein GcvH [Myxococcales bacterium]
MADTEIREGYLYTKDHEWIGAETPRRVGITAYAVEQLGDITMVDLKVKVGERIEAGQAFGVVESVKSVSDLYAPVSGVVAAINGELDARPELVNEDPYGQAWMISLQPDREPTDLMDAEAYRAFLRTL